LKSLDCRIGFIDRRPILIELLNADRARCLRKDLWMIGKSTVHQIHKFSMFLLFATHKVCACYL
jgi:hypothetical protein